MNFAHAEKIAAAVLYEGYILYPYRASSTKNVQRWNFGTLYPRDYVQAQRPTESFRFTAECLIETAPDATPGASLDPTAKAKPDTRFDIRVRFLHLARQQSPDKPQWDVGIERTVELAGLSLTDLAASPLHHSFSFAAGSTKANTPATAEAMAESITGECDLRVETLIDGLYRLSLVLTNTTDMIRAEDMARSSAMLQSFVSAHALLGVTGGAFVSLLEPTEALSAAAAACHNTGVFPVLVGEAGERSTMLCSPIILYDYPQIAPESLGDFFDGTEMDEMLALRVLTLTDEEKLEMRNTDDRASRILERTELLPEEQLAKVHGAIRGMRPVSAAAPHPSSMTPEAVPEPVPEPFPEPVNDTWDPFAERPPVDSVRVFGVELRTGSRVRLWPQKKADIMDMALEGKTAVIEAIEQDLEDNIQFAVVVDDDPGREFGMMRQPGHRFFFAPEEVEPLPAVAAIAGSTPELTPEVTPGVL